MSMAPSDPVADTAPAAEVKPVGPLAEYLDLAKTVIYALLIALVLRIVLFQPYTIPSASMEPALREGDYIIVSKYAYGWSRRSIPFAPPLFHGRLFAHQPKRGDVVVFAFPPDPSKDFIKRLIGLPGDTIQVKEGVVFVNGKATPEVRLPPEVSDTAFDSPLQLDRFQESVGKHAFIVYSQNRQQPVENTGVFTVPQGCYFMMGDNRDNSLDSRFNSGVTDTCQTATPQPFLGASEPGVGFVPAENLEGRAEIILTSWRHGASLFKPWTWLNLNWGRLFHRIT
jgi:signal peptidase I